MVTATLLVAVVLLPAAGEPAASSSPAVTRVRAALASADRVIVVEDDFTTGRPVRRTLLDTSRPEVLAGLRAAIEPRPVDGVCGCIPNLWIVLRRGRRTLVELGYLGQYLKPSEPWGDVELAGREALLDWFDDQGVAGPRQEALEEAERARRDAASEERWKQAMPEALRPLWAATHDTEERYRSGAEAPPLDPWRAALAAALPERGPRIAALLRWYGSGDGPWSGYPAYEGWAEALLQDFLPREVVAVLEQNGGDAALMEGGARLFAMWRPDEGPLPREAVPAPLKAALLAHALRSDQADNRERALSAFGR